MNINLDDYKEFKIIGHGITKSDILHETFPTHRVEYLSKIVEESGFLKYLGRSRIDNAPMYVLTDLAIRKLKIAKILKNNTLIEKVNKIFDIFKENDIKILE